MKFTAAIFLTAIGGTTAFTSLSQSRSSAVKPLNYGWDAVNAAAAAPPAAPAPVVAQPPAPAAAAAPPASPPAPKTVEEDEPMSKAWAAKVDYDPSKDVFPVFPPGFKTFDQIWAEFQANKAAGRV
jgi:hypothetical protein